MTLRVDLSRRAFADLHRNAAWWATHRSAEQAARWFDGFVDALDSLAERPERYPLARENAKCDLEIRELHYGLGSRPTHRAIYTIESNCVVVLAIRHGAEQDMTADELRQD